MSIILAVHNEEATIVRRLKNLVELLTESGLDGEVIVVSDGSTDATVDLGRTHASEDVRVIELPRHAGKALALTAGWAMARHEILVFADVRQTWDRRALRHLVENFADPEVGAVSGDLVVKAKPGVMTGVGLYWGFEKWLRRQESEIHAMVGVTGAISAVRRELFRPIPPGTLLDDVYWPSRVAMQGYRVIHEERAHAYDHLPDKPRDEFRRKVRTLSGNFQLLARLPGAALPWANPLWVQFISHKLLRLVVPWALLLLLACSYLLSAAFYQAAFWTQVSFYALGLAEIGGATRLRNRLTSAVGSFLVLNAAAFAAFWVWAGGRAGQSWAKVEYNQAPAEAVRRPSKRLTEHEVLDSAA